MQVQGSKALTLLRQPGSMRGGQGDQRLIFLYPFFIDKTLTQYTDVLRDFLSVDFIGKIKEQNVINVTSKATQIGVIGQGRNALNPAQEVRKALYNRYDAFSSQDSPRSSRGSSYEYQDKINSFLRFIQNQIQYDPKYNQLRPIISSITIEENLINIPLIIGTKSFSVDAFNLYWIILVSMAYGDIPLDNPSNIDRIRKIIENMPQERFLDFLFDQRGRQQLLKSSNVTYNFNRTRLTNQRTNDPLSRFGMEYRKNLSNVNLHRVARYVRTELSKTCNQLKIALNIDQWDAENHHISTTNKRITTGDVPLIQTRTQKAHFEKAMASFNSYINGTIVPILQSLEYVLGPTRTDIDYHERIQMFINNCTSSMDQIYLGFSNHIREQLAGTAKSSYDRLQSALSKIELIKQNCEANKELTDEIIRIMSNELDRYIYLDPDFNNTDLESFTNAVVNSAQKLETHSGTLGNWLKSSLNDTRPYENNIRMIEQRFKAASYAFFYRPEAAALYDRNVERDPQIMEDRYKNFHRYICNSTRNLNNCAERFSQYVDKIESAIPKLIMFSFLWNFMSYVCSYMRDVDIDIQIQRRDALDFPNYCMVLPLSLVRYLYTLHISRNVKELLRSADPENDEAVAGIIRDGITAQQFNVHNMIRILNSRLKIPNLIVVDERKKDVYYQFMYMSKSNKINFNTMTNYIKHQENVLPGF